MIVQMKQVIAFGEPTTLYRAVCDDGWGSLWHRSRAKAMAAAERHELNRKAA